MELFEKIFKEKSGNLWANKNDFKKVPKKYLLIKRVKNIRYEEFLTNFDFKNQNIPPCKKISEELEALMKQITNVYIYQKQMQAYKIDVCMSDLTHEHL